MRNDKELSIFEKICFRYDLGTLTEEPRPLSGGFMHKMYSVFTDKGKYAVKLLNPFIMQRETVMENYRVAEELELLLEQQKLPVLPALIFDGCKMQIIDGQYFYVFEWCEGKALKSSEIKEKHCMRIGSLLAQIHNLDRREAACERKKLHIDWDYYINAFAEKNQELYELMKENRALLYESQEKGNAAVKRLPAVSAICHNDMDSKNVLWVGEECRIIDLECLCYANPMMELYELALCWCGYEECNIDFGLFRTFLYAYAQAGGELPTDWETMYYSNYGRLEWLEYNCKRALGIECAEDEIGMGISEVKTTMAHVIYYHNVRAKILAAMD